jgi:hypothetical protein
VKDGDQELVVSVWDPSDAGPQPRGKQVLKPRSIWYTPTSGIWQTVWLEPLPAQSIDRLKLTPDADAGTMTIESTLRLAADGYVLRAVAFADGQQVATAEGSASSPLMLTIPTPRLWSPGEPFLYDLKVALTRNGKTVDAVSSYFGLRKISVGRGSDGAARLLLNNKPLFQFGFLDQGFWPDGLHTPPTDEAIRFDIASTLSFGMNLSSRTAGTTGPTRWACSSGRTCRAAAITRPRRARTSPANGDASSMPATTTLPSSCGCPSTKGGDSPTRRARVKWPTGPRGTIRPGSSTTPRAGRTPARGM